MPDTCCENCGHYLEHHKYIAYTDEPQTTVCIFPDNDSGPSYICGCSAFKEREH